MQKGAGPDAAMDKANRNKMLSQGEGTVGKGQVDESSIKTLMAIAWVEIQMPKKDTYVEEEISPRGAAAYNITFNFNKKVTGDIRDKLRVPFLRHVMQQAIISEKEHGPDIGYSEFKIRRIKCRVDVKFMK